MHLTSITNQKRKQMIAIFIGIGILVVINFLLLQFSCNEGLEAEEAEE